MTGIPFEDRKGGWGRYGRAGPRRVIPVGRLARSLDSYDAAAATLLIERVTKFLGRVDCT